ncbi:MAG: DUF2461 domain-containing protein [Ruminococcaceae bacterium]|nr:DUF2461 domain-containing protein [Oscillospiraceae bacterium]
MADNYRYDGITSDALFLLARNRFENDKNFYEEHKPEIKKSVITPVRQIIDALLDDMFSYDNRMVLIPWKMISRIRRDTRYSKDKSLYRENVWVMFMRDKKANPYIPCFWLEIFPDRYTCGIGSFYTNASYLQLYREKILAEPDRFRKAVKSCEKTGAVLSLDCYKKQKPGDCPEDLLNFYNTKSLFFRCDYFDITELESSNFIEKIRGNYKAFYPMYKFLLEVTDRYVALNGGE